MIPLDTNSILRPTKEKKQYTLINLGVKHANKPSHKEALVGDGIQRRNNETRRGWARWKSYTDDLLSGLTSWCKLPHIIMGIPSKDPE